MTKFDITYLPTKVGEGTIEVNGYLLHSKYDPLKEAQRIVEKEIIEERAVVIFGLGKGYILNELKKKKYNTKNLIIVEPITEVKDVVDSQGFTIIKSTNEKEIKEAVQELLNYFNREVQVISLPNYDKVCVEEYKQLLQIVKENQLLNVVNDNALRGQSHLWQENEIKNTLYAYCGNTLGELEKAYEIPVIIASGGPSLIKQLPLLKEVRSKVILIAAGSTIITLQNEGVIPDYIASIDGNIGNFERHFMDNNFEKAQLIYSFSNYYKIQRNFSNPSYGFVDSNLMELTEQLNDRYGFKSLPQIEGGGSVANYALSIARYISTGPIALIGQDLAFTDNQTHAKHNIGALEVTKGFLEARGAIKIEGYYGDEVFADYSLISMKKSFERIIQTIENAETIFNCTEGGAKIVGMNQLSFTDFCNKYISVSTKKEIIMPLERQHDLNFLVNVYLKEIKRYKDMLIDIKTALRYLNNVKKQGYFSQETLGKLDKIDKNIKVNLNSLLMKTIAAPLIMDIMLKYQGKNNETEKEKFERVFSQNEELYTRLLYITEQSKNFTEEVLREARVRLEENKNESNG
jgi:hypothetical protein